MTSELGTARSCAWCAGPIPKAHRRDSICCSVRCRQARHRFTTAVGQASRSAGVPLRLAYADPPYPGMSARYYSTHPDFAGEVDHGALIRRLSTYDGWALSTSASSLQQVLALCPPGVRVAAWHRGERPTRSARPQNAWEPVIYFGGRPVAEDLGATRRVAIADPSRVATLDASRSTAVLRDASLSADNDASSPGHRDGSRPGQDDASRAAQGDESRGSARDASPRGQRDASCLEPEDVSPEYCRDASRLRVGDASRSAAARRIDSLVFHARPRRTDPSRVIGSKPAVFCRWMFDLLGARAGDELEDLFPGSGGVGRAWESYVGGRPDDDQQVV